MTIDTYKRDKESPLYKRAIPFIEGCLKSGIPLDCIDTNDFSSNTNPGVYIHNKENLFRCKVYHRMSIKDVAKALNFYNAKNARYLTNITVS